MELLLSLWSLAVLLPIIISPTTALFKITFSAAFLLPIRLSRKAIFFYDGHDCSRRSTIIQFQRFLFIVVAQSIPLATILTFSWIPSLIWLLCVISVVVFMRVRISSIKSSILTNRPKTPSAASQSSPSPPKPPQECYQPSIGLYHPNAHQRAGGEMVLWRLVKALLTSQQHPISLTIFSNTISAQTLQSMKQSRSAKKPTSADSVSQPDLYSLIDTLSITTRPASLSSSGNQPRAQPATSSPPTQSPTVPTPPPSPVDPLDIPQLILDQVQSIFGIDLALSSNKTTPPINNTQISFEFLSHTAISDGQNYSRLILYLQTINAIFPLFFYFFSITIMNPLYYLLNPSTPQPPLSHQTFPTFILDTSGYPIISLLCFLLGVPCGSYVHYPILQHDMIYRNLHDISTIYTPQPHSTAPTPPEEEKPNTPPDQLKDSIRTARKFAKHCYFAAFLPFYTTLLKCNQFLFANGTWTYNHLRILLRSNALEHPSGRPSPSLAPSTVSTSTNNAPSNELSTNKVILGKLYPPCNLSPQQQLQPNESTITINHRFATIKPIFVVLGQYRPEKQQRLILDSFTSLLQSRLDSNQPLSFPSSLRSDGDKLMLVFIGTYRPEDFQVASSLMQVISATTLVSKPNPTTSIKLTDHVKCLFNISLADLQAISKRGLCGIHAMVDEHFGIAVVELMFNCWSIIGHKSAGPYLDIIVPSKQVSPVTIDGSNEPQTPHLSPSSSSNDDNAVGYVASTLLEYTTMMADVLKLYQTDRDHLCVQSQSPTPSNYVSVLGQMNRRGKERALQLFTTEVFDHSVHHDIVPLISQYIL